MERLAEGDFEGTQLRRPGRYVVLFAADWCGFCRAFLPRFSRLEGASGFRVASVDLTDTESSLWERLGVEIVPTVIVFQDGRPVFRADGVAGVGLGAADLERVRTAASAPAAPVGRI